jgi:hypothetical protein
MSPRPRDLPGRPTCWNCGYDLRGLPVEGTCPECGTPIWSFPPARAAAERADEAQRVTNWGIASILLFFLCLGPVAALVAIPALIDGHHLLARARRGEIAPSATGNAALGVWLAWATVVLSVLAVLVIAFG